MSFIVEFTCALQGRTTETSVIKRVRFSDDEVFQLCRVCDYIDIFPVSGDRDITWKKADGEDFDMDLSIENLECIKDMKEYIPLLKELYDSVGFPYRLSQWKGGYGLDSILISFDGDLRSDFREKFGKISCYTMYWESSKDELPEYKNLNKDRDHLHGPIHVPIFIQLWNEKYIDNKIQIK